MGFLILFITALFSQPVLACAVCGFGDDSRYAFISTTALMTFVPLILVGGLAYWVYRRFKHAEEYAYSSENHTGLADSDQHSVSDTKK